MRMYRYDRYAAGQIKGAEDPEQYEVDEGKGLIKINWPPFAKAERIERESGRQHLTTTTTTTT